MLCHRIKKRFRHLQKWAKRLGMEAFRLYDRDIPEIPLVLDLYGDAVAGALYKRPYEKDENEENDWLSVMKAAIVDALQIDPSHVFLKQRQRQRQQGTSLKRAQYEKSGDLCFTRTVSENGILFKVNLSDYLDTGLFLDRRIMRILVRGEASGKRVLNLFSYTGSFSVYAAAGGAASTDSVDLSNTYQSWAKDNFSLNGFNAETAQLKQRAQLKKLDRGKIRSLTAAPGAIGKNIPHTLIRADVGAFLQQAITERRCWDMIILDPPAFSNSTMAPADFDLQRDCEDMIIKCLNILSPAGKLWFSASARSFKTNAEELEMALNAASAVCGFPGIKVTDISKKIVDEDFRGRKMPGAFVVEKTI